MWFKRSEVAPAMHISAGSRGQPLIDLNGVTKIFKIPAGEFTALRNVNLSFERGEFAAIMGKSGSGKSTLINMIAGIDHPTSGQVRVAEVEIHRMSESRLAVWRGRNLGIVFQFFQLLPTLNVLENTMLPMDYCNVYNPNEREARALGLLEKLGIEDLAEQLPGELSGGQQQIAAIARALANDPAILLADEPTGNLDSRSAEHVLEIFGELAAQGKTILIVTHDLTLAQRAARRVLISDGELINETVAQALPMLTHPQMLKITRSIEARTFAPGSNLPKGEAALYLVASGEVEILNQNGNGSPKILGNIGTGQWFSELDLVTGQPCGLQFRAGSRSQTELFTLNIEVFSRLIADSPVVAQALQKIAEKHRTQLRRPAAAQFERGK
jgi:ABC-type lipoprotein export system ATPase subunit